MPRSPGAPDSNSLARFVLRATGASGATVGERVQPLWGGYGELRRVTLSGATTADVVVKYIVPPAGGESSHDGPDARSHRRKLRSYGVERAFYELYAKKCGARCRVPAPLHAAADGSRMLLVLEDLDAAGFPVRAHRASEKQLEAGLRWLAFFHATFLGTAPDSLWRRGSYWHLATRPDELRALDDPDLRRAAPHLDARLAGARFRTLIHGDAKLENFCFTPEGSDAAAVDFQYTGGGVGVQDVAYFLTSSVPSARLESDATRYLDVYFAFLRQARGSEGDRANEYAATVESEALEAEWRALYPVACADFYRFLLGWAGEAGGHDEYLERVTRGVLAQRGSNSP